MKKTIRLFLIVLFVFAVGCMRSTQKQSIEHQVAGVFVDSIGEKNYEYYEKRIQKFREKEKLVKENVTTLNDLKQMGLDPFADNVGYWEGIEGLNKVGFNFQEQVSHPEQMDSLIARVTKRFKVVVYSLRNIRKGSGYFNTASRITNTEGSDVKFVVILKDDVVIAASEGGFKHLEIKLTENFVGGGMYDFFRDIKLMLEVLLYIFIATKLSF